MAKPGEYLGQPRVLMPFNKREGMSLRDAAKLAGKSEGTIRNWCVDHGIGRRVGGGVWIVSRVALAAHLDGDSAALAAYLGGDRSGELVAAYFRRLGLTALLEEFRSSAPRSQFSQKLQSSCSARATTSR